MRYIINFFPIILAAVVTLARLDFAVRWIDAVGAWVNRTRQGLCEKERNAWRRVMLLGIGGLYRLFKWTEGIGNPHLKSGIRLAGGLYFAVIFVTLIVYAVFAVIMTAVVLLVLYLLLDSWLNDGRTPVRYRGGGAGGSRGGTHYADDGRKTGDSHSREGFFGNTITDHYDKSGRQTGHSETREGFFGPVTDHYDKSGKHTGHGEHREGFFGNQITDEYDDSGKKIGHSEVREGFFGPVTDHYDNSGKHTGHTES